MRLKPGVHRALPTSRRSSSCIRCQAGFPPLPDRWEEAAQLYLQTGRDWAAVDEAIATAVATGAPLPGDDHEPRLGSELPVDVPTARSIGRVRQTWALLVAYNGGAFTSFTWQKEAPEQTVIGRVDAALQPLLGEKRPFISSAGRTDAGVSAVGQCLSFYSWAPITPMQLHHAIDAAGGGDLRLQAAVRVPRSFHATFSARWRRYVYLLPSAGEGDGSAQMLNALFEPLVGSPHDFLALGRGLPAGKNSTTLLHHCSASPVLLRPAGRAPSPALRIDVVGNRFLRRQVRTLVATAVHAAKAFPGDELALLRLSTAGQQRMTAPAAPSRGLCFAQAGYAPFAPELMAR